ncbi:MAG: alanine racemase [Christensenellales bacterium]|jgi:alanine racemase
MGAERGRQGTCRGLLDELRATRLCVHVGAYRHNIAMLKAVCAPAALMAVVKANAYGHGLVPMARAAIEAGAQWLGVAMAEEGVLLRRAQCDAPILVLGLVNAKGAQACVQHGLTMTVADVTCIEQAQHAAEQAGTAAYVHLKLDTGMGRIGTRTPAQVAECMSALQRSPKVQLTGVYTHLADADNPDPIYTDAQLARFAFLRGMLPNGLITHTAASAAALARSDTRFDMVRIGIASYGYAPVPTELPLQPCLSWTAEVVFVKDLAPGDSVSYGCTFTAGRPMRVATLAVGYGDGYPRALSGRGRVLLHGRSCSILGRVCMDQMMVDVSHVPQTKPGDSATLLGRDGEEAIDANELARLLDTIPYEVLMLPKQRVPVIYDEE